MEDYFLPERVMLYIVAGDSYHKLTVAVLKFTVQCRSFQQYELASVVLSLKC